MDKMIKKYLPMTETAFYILLALKEPLHGYGIILKVEDLTEGRIRIGPGTIYGTLSKMEADGLIIPVGQEDRRKIYLQSSIGSDLVKLEVTRLKELIKNAERCGEK